MSPADCATAGAAITVAPHAIFPEIGVIQPLGEASRLTAESSGPSYRIRTSFDGRCENMGYASNHGL